MNVVLDNNVLISAALLKQSIPFKDFEKTQKHYSLLRSFATLTEFRNTIFKVKFDKYFFDVSSREGFVISFIAASTDVNITYHVNDCRDPKDNMYLELALSGDADVIVTGDDDLLVLNPFHNIPVISPKDFLNKY